MFHPARMDRRRKQREARDVALLELALHAPQHRPERRLRARRLAALEGRALDEVDGLAGAAAQEPRSTKSIRLIQNSFSFDFKDSPSLKTK